MNESTDNFLYQTEDGQTKIEATLANDTGWLTADQMVKLSGRSSSLPAASPKLTTYSFV